MTYYREPEGIFAKGRRKNKPKPPLPSYHFGSAEGAGGVNYIEFKMGIVKRLLLYYAHTKPYMLRYCMGSRPYILKPI